MILSCPQAAAQARPGQFVNLYCRSESRLLPRPISICRADAESGTLTLIYAAVGAGTREFSTYTAGDQIGLLGPLGNGYDLEKAAKAKSVYLLGGGLGIPPLLFLAEKLAGQGCASKVRAFLGFRSAAYMGQEFEAYCQVFYASDDGSCGFQGTCLDRLKAYRTAAFKGQEGTESPAALYVCGPVPMLKAVQKEYEKDEALTLSFSLEERMGCGYGACFGCAVRIRQEDGTILPRKVCQDGPVFDGKAVMLT